MDYLGARVVPLRMQVYCELKAECKKQRATCTFWHGAHSLHGVRAPAVVLRALRLQVYYELKAEREKQGMEGEVALIRVEQLAPFPFDLVCRELRRYPNAEIMWCALPVQLAPVCLVRSQHAESGAAHQHNSVRRQEHVRQRSC